MPAPTTTPRPRTTKPDPVSVATVALRECAATAGTDPVAAFGLALQAWRSTRWARLGDLVERLSTLAESSAARELRATTWADWNAYAHSAASADRGVLLTGLRSLTAPAAGARLEAMADWGPDPRVATALHDMIRHRPWTYDGSGPTWTKLFRLVKLNNDPRLLAADWLDLDRLRAHIERFPHDWLSGRIVRAASRIAANPPPPVPAEVTALLDAIEAALPPAPQAAVIEAVVDARAVALPDAFEVRTGMSLPILDVHDVRTTRAGLLVSLNQHPPKGASAPIRPETFALVDDDGTVVWARSRATAAAVNPSGTMVAVVSTMDQSKTSRRVDLTVYRVRDDTVVARTTLCDQVLVTARGKAYMNREAFRDARQLVEWGDDTTVVAAVFQSGVPRGLFRLDTATADLSTLDTGGPDGYPPAHLSIDRDEDIVATCHGDRILIHDLRTGRLLQAFRAGKSVRRQRSYDHLPPIGALRAVGQRRVAFVCNGLSSTDPAHNGSFVTVIDADTGWCTLETEVAEVGALVTLAGDRLATVEDAAAAGLLVQPVGERTQLVIPTGPVNRWVWTGDSIAAYTRGEPLRCFDPETAEQSRVVTPVLPTVPHVAVSTDGAVVVAAAGAGALIWGRKPKPTRVMSSAQNDGISSVAVSGGGFTAVAVQQRADIRGPGGGKAGVLRANRVVFTQVVGCPTDDRFAAIGVDGNLFLFDHEHLLAAEIDCGSGGGVTLTALRWSPSGRLIAVVNAAGTVRIVDPSTETVLSTVDIGGPARDVHFVPDETRLLVWTGDGELSWLALASGDRVGWRHEPGLTGLAAHPRNGWYAFGYEDGTVAVRGGDGDAVAALGRHFGPVTALAFAADRLVVGAGRPGTADSVTVYRWATAPEASA